MIKPEYYGKNGLGKDLYISKSKNNKVIRQIETGNEYDEAIDVADENGNIAYTYEETEKDIEIEEVDTTIQPSNMEVQYYGKEVV